MGSTEAGEHDQRHPLSLPVLAPRNRDALLLETDPRKIEAPGCHGACVGGARRSRQLDGAMQAERDL